MKTLSPAVITLPWRQDAAEFYFSRLTTLPWAMLLHSGYADHPYSRFDIVVRIRSDLHFNHQNRC